MSSGAPSGPPVEETLAWEAEQAPRAAVAAIVSGLLTLAGIAVGIAGSRDVPQVTINTGLHDAANPAAPNGLSAPKVDFYNHHLASLTISGVCTALAAPLAAATLYYLYKAVRARRPEAGQGGLIALVAGGVATLVGTLVLQIALAVSIGDFVDGSDHSTKAAHDALQPSAVVAGSLVGGVGRLALGVGFVIVALNAMRVGLLTRFMGVLGIMAGVFFLPFLPGLPIVQTFWLLALGVLFLGRMPSGTPPAWETGRAEPWPTRQELMEQQQREREAKGAGMPPDAAGGTGRTPKDLPPPGPVEPAPERPEHSRSKKKRRR
jgi:hypothetical protein